LAEQNTDVRQILLILKQGAHLPRKASSHLQSFTGSLARLLSQLLAVISKLFSLNPILPFKIRVQG
jgi:hypothetical protein